MIAPATLVLAAAILAVGTFACRLAGPVLRARVELSPRVEKLVAVAVAVVFAALIATVALLDGHDLAGFARPAGVTVGGILAWRKAPFVVVVLAAAATAAGLRLLGVP
jgi:hypothetical protein